MICIQSKVAASQLLIESDRELINIEILDCKGKSVQAPVICRKTSENKNTIIVDASVLELWSPNHPVLYTLNAGEETMRFGYCELATMGNHTVLLNGTPCFLRGYIRGIVAHEHPNMTGRSLKDAAVKNIRQAKKYGFNLVRFHSTVPTPEFVEAADEEGLFIHMEIGFAYERDEHGNKKKLAMDNAKWRETILRYRNHPSVAIFCIGNEMHKSGHQKEVHKLYAEGKKLAPAKLIMDNSGWGEFDRPTADIFSQHIAYYYPFKHHADMFDTDNCWRMNGSTYDEPLDENFSGNAVDAAIRREATPLRPVLAHEALHYIEIPDYDMLNRKFDEFCQRAGGEYLQANNITKPRYLTDLPALIERKKLTAKMPDYIAGSRHFKQMAIKTYLEKLRHSRLCGFEMLQLADCLKYENKNGILDFFDDDKYFDVNWVNSFNADAALLAKFEDEVFFYDIPVTMELSVSNFLEEPLQRGTAEVRIDGETVWTGKNTVLAGGLQKLAALTLNFKEKSTPAKVLIQASFKNEQISLENSWNIWLYPHPAVSRKCELALNDRGAERFFTVPDAPEADIFITDTLNDRVFEKLAENKHVFLFYHRDKAGNQYYLPGALERFKPCIWDRGSNLGGFVNSKELAEALATERYFDANLQPLLENAYKVNLDKFPLPVTEHINGIDKPVRDRMKGLLHGVKDFIDEDTLRNFSHCFSVSAANGGTLTVCTLNFNDAPPSQNFFAALINCAETLRQAPEVTPEQLKACIVSATEAGVCKEDVMNHFWEIDNKPVEDTLFWEETGVDLRKKR